MEKRNPVLVLLELAFYIALFYFCIAVGYWFGGNPKAGNETIITNFEDIVYLRQLDEFR